MSRSLLDDIKAAAEAKYGSFVIDLGNGESVELINPLRLPRERREALRADEKAEESQDELESMQGYLRVLCKTDGAADKLFAAVGEDLAVYATILEQYKEATQLGDRLASAS